jgi:biopolymer transport protein ExbD
MSVVKESWSEMIRRRRSIRNRFSKTWFRNFRGIPWIDALIIMVLLLYVNNRLTIIPGMVFELPQAPLRGGTQGAVLTAVMIPVVQDVSSGSETLVFFDDERFSMEDEEFDLRLSGKVRARVQASATHDMLLLADKNIPHGDVMRFVNIAREAGINRVNVGEKPR